MKRVLAALLIAAPALLTTACEMAPVQADAAAGSEQRVYTTGSNIGRRPSEGVPGAEVVSVGRDAAEQQINVRGAVPLPLPNGGH
jgi:hypothetical protein